MVLACRSCNQKKGNSSCSEFGWPVVTPITPTYVPLLFRGQRHFIAPKWIETYFVVSNGAAVALPPGYVLKSLE